ncbi:MAG: glycosyltransferase [Bacillota bacterium]
MSKKIILPSIGSRGDIQPYIALASVLQNSGFQVTVATHPCMRELVEFYSKTPNMYLAPVTNSC